jgi:hypothetical protein
MLRGCQRENRIPTFRFAADPQCETDREKNLRIDHTGPDYRGRGVFGKCLLLTLIPPSKLISAEIARRTDVCPVAASN